ncbi:hypothetical protein [Halorientalis salina]|uniref:hypothetical protein n=1 Tax=Halorientalis salina TaxID=2932266 RepID=UPI0010AB5EBE|nr:hypothetical protein [Halorientalis salina]
MAELLTHVLVAYVLLTVGSWQIDGLTPRWVPIGMAGAAIPDLVKVGILVDERTVEALLGFPFSYGPISTIGGVVVIAAGITLCFTEDRPRVFGLLVAGGTLSLVLDGLRMYADGQASFWLYPIWWRPPTPSLYVTSDPRVTAVAVVVAAGVFLADRDASDAPSERR